MGYIITFVITVIIYSVIIYLIYQHSNSDLISYLKNKEEYIENLKELKNNCCELTNEKENLNKTLNNLQIQKIEITNSLSELERQAREAGTKFFEQQQEIAQTKLENAMERIGKEYQKYEQECQDEYAALMEDLANASSTAIGQWKQLALDLQTQIDEKKLQLEQESSIVVAVTEANKRTAAEAAKKDFYRLQLSEVDLQEIAKLREIVPYLRYPEALNKVIWKTYYEKPYTDLVGRIIGSGIHTGIYKITNLQNGMCYVGQAVNLAERFRQHIKRGLGAEPITQNKLYPAMQEYGVENFTFEVIEECERSLLNEREDFYQDFFKAKEFGYSIK